MMSFRRLLAGVIVLTGLSVLSWVRADGRMDSCDACDPVCTVESAGEGSSSTRDEARQRFRANQSHHWRQVMIGGH